MRPLLGLAAAVLAFSWALARRRAARIAAPLEEMTRVAHALGAGDFAIEPRPAAIYEAAEAGRALQATARRLGALLEQARSAAADASHQVRTPLTALRLGLERFTLQVEAGAGHVVLHVFFVPLIGLDAEEHAAEVLAAVNLTK